MRWLAQRPWVGTIVRLVLGVVWIWASLDKLSSPRTFVQAVRAYDATPEWLSKGIGYGLPTLEFCIGVVLILGIVVRIAAAASAVLFFVFLIGLIQAAARGIQLECGCFGGGGTTTGGTNYTLDILRDLGLLILAAFLVVWPLTRFSVDEFLARHDHVAPPSAKRMRSDQGRRKYNAMVEMRRKEARTRALWIGASFSAIIVLISVIGIGVQSDRAKIEGSLTAANATVDTGIVFGKKAAATVDVYEDFQCPNCANFEATAGATVDKAVRANKAQVRFHIISLSSLDTQENNYYSSRGANAGYCASDVSVDFFVKFHNLMFGKKVQPPEGSGGLANTEIIKFAKQAGLPKKQSTDFSSCVTEKKHQALVEAITEKASQDKVNGTPTLRVNGKDVNANSASFTKAVNKALEKGPKPNPSKTPTPTTSKSAATSASPSPSAKKSSGATSSAP